jgi:CDGSH-type Zn-finger protein
MTDIPIIARKAPYAVEVTAGKTYFWCACGRSRKQPFCDGSHKVTTLRPVRHVAEKGGKPRFIQIRGVDLDAEPQPYMLYTSNEDVPGYIGALGAKLGDLGINIATFALGRSGEGGEPSRWSASTSR